MRAWLWPIIAVTALGTYSVGQSKWVCPPSPRNATAAAKPSPAPTGDSDTYFLGTVTVLVVVDTKGNPHEPQVIHGLNLSRSPGKEINQDAERAVREAHFKPALKDSHPVIVKLTVEIDYWRHDDDIIRCPDTPVARAPRKEDR